MNALQIPPPQSNKINSKGHIGFLRSYRGLAILFVILTHTDRSSLSFETLKYVLPIWGNATYFFVFISGYIFWHYEGPNAIKGGFNYGKFIKKKFANLALPYILLNSICITLFNKDFTLKSFMLELYQGGGVVPPLWYIPAIIIIYIASSIIAYIASNNRVFIFFLLVFLTVNLTSFRPDRHVYPMYLAFHFLGAFLLGICTVKHSRLFDTGLSMPLLLILSFFFYQLDVKFTATPNFWPLFDQRSLDAPLEHLVNFNNLSKMIMALFLFSLFLYLSKKNINLQILAFFGRYSAGLFFFHAILIKLYESNGWVFLQGFSFLVKFLIITGFSVLISVIIKAVFKEKSGMLIGC